jgi:predicted Zn-dependent protease
MEPLNPAVHRAIADIHLKKNDEPALVESLEKAAALDGQDYASRRELVRLMMDRTDYHSAARYIDEALGIWPYDRQLHEWAATAFARLGRTARAEREKTLIPLSKTYRGGPATRVEPERPVEH